LKKAAFRALALILIVISIFNFSAMAVTGPAGYKQYTPEEYYEKLEYISKIIKEICYHSAPEDDPVRLGVQFMAETAPELMPSLKNAAGMSDDELRLAIIEAIKTPEDFYTLADHILAYDRYMIYVRPDDYDRVYSQPTTFVGIGVLLEFKNGENAITVVYQHSPAKKAGLKAGDIFVEVDGQNVAGLSLNELAGVLKGPENSTVTVGIRRKGVDRTLYFTMKRTAVVADTAVGEYLGDGIYKLSIFSFYGLDTTIETISALNEARELGAEKIIIDLRDNPGGDMDALLNITNLFIKEDGKMMLAEEYRQGRVVHRSTGSNYDFSSVFVLINEHSASAAEILAGTLKGLGIAKVIGQKSYGKGMAQYHIELDNLDYAVVSVSKLELPETGYYDLEGITPHYIVENRLIDYPLPEINEISSPAPIYVGSVGDNVLAIEQRLSALGYFTAEPDRSFDAATLSSINSMRKKAGLEATDICGIISLTELENQIAELAAIKLVDDLQLKKAIELALAS
jgi:carboxyl-terminal processing protease